MEINFEKNAAKDREVEKTVREFLADVSTLEQVKDTFSRRIHPDHLITVIVGGT